MRIELVTINYELNGHTYHLISYYDNRYLISVDDRKGFIEFYVSEDGHTRFFTSEQYVEYLHLINLDDIRAAVTYINEEILRRLDKLENTPQTYANFSNN